VVEETEATMHEQLEINLLGPWRLSAAAARAMQAHGRGGRIVTVLSRAAVTPLAGQAAYQVSKAAAARVVELMALELRDRGITVNGVMPSTMDTPANRQAMAKADWSRWTPVEHVAEVMAWLLSDAAADVSGALVPVYGRS
jgi:NAD(P)-dependent dehydrogenase (short-subunit alcohol dehydrogenase family)